MVFAIEAMGARVAEVRLTPDGPRLLLADHIQGDAPTLVHRVASLRKAIDELTRRGSLPEAEFGIPHGPCATFTTPGGQRLALYELTALKPTSASAEASATSSRRARSPPGDPRSDAEAADARLAARTAELDRA